MKIISLDRKSIKIKLATAFVITSIIPILLVNIIYYYNTSKLVQPNRMPKRLNHFKSP